MPTRPLVLCLGLLTSLALLSLPRLAAAPTEFTVESPVDGRKFSLAEARGKYVALHFLLKTECPVCLRHTRDFAKRTAELPEVAQVFLKPDSADEIKRWVGRLGDEALKGITIYRDPDAALAKAFEIPDGYKFHGEVVHFPALVLLNQEGKEVFRHVGKNNADRFDFDQLAAKVAELKKPASAPSTKPAAGAK
jgi:peroxiredoxin Q/BCP